MAYALSHEFTHFVEEMSPQKFRAFTDILFAEMGKSQVDVKSLIDGKMSVLKAQNEGLSESELRSLAYSEAVAEMMETAMTDTDVLTRISAKIKKTDNSLWGKIKNFLQGLVEKLKSAYRGLNPDSAIARLAKETIASSEAVLDAFSDAAADAVMNYQLQDGESVIAGTVIDRNGDSVEYLNSNRVTDKKTLDFLNDQETVTTYKTMQLVDGKLYPPMAAVVAGSYEDHSELGQWEAATEHPELIKLDKNGKPKFTLNKGKGKGSLAAAYNPYMHSSNLVLNDQFSGAYDRPNLVTVECKVPISELTSGYKAQYAKDSVGWHAWHTGTVAGALRQQTGIERQVLLSRWIMPVRILSDAEVASMYAELLNGTGIAVPDNVVPPKLLSELKKAGVGITESGRLDGQKNTAREGERYSPRMTADMTEQERYEKLKNLSLTVIASAKKNAVADAEEKYGTAIKDGTNLKATDRKKLFKKIGELFNVYTDYDNRDIDLTFTFSGENMRESISKQKRYYYSFMKMLSCFGDVIDSAIGIETHNRNEAGYKVDPTLKNVYVMVSAFQDGENITPVKLEIKEFSDKPNTLYVAIALDSIQKGKLSNKNSGIVTEGNTVSGVTQSAPPLIVSLADLFANVNPQDSSFLKYVPTQFLTEQQRAGEKYSSRTSSDSEYLNLAQNPEENREALSRIVEQAAREAGYTEVVYHGTNADFTVFDKKTIGKNFGAISDLGFYFTPYYEDARGYSTDWGKQGARVMKGVLKFQNPLVIEDTGWGSAIEQTDNRHGDLLRWAQEGNHDGIIVRSMDEEFLDDNGNHDTVYIAFDSNQFKSLDPVTYDDNGDVIPLSQRFNAENPDIRYSSRVDSVGRELSEGQAAYFANSEVRDENGNLKVVYHGSPAVFTEFSTDFLGTHGSSEGQGFYFTDYKPMAEGYRKSGGQLLEGYLNIQKPLSDSEVTLSRAEVKRLLLAIDPTGDDLVLNYDSRGGMGYPSRSWYNRAVNDTLNAVMGNDSDSEILAELANAMGDYGAVLEKAKSVLGYDGYIVSGKYDNATVYVAFDSSQFKNSDNRNPTGSKDIRYSQRGQTVQNENERLKTEIAYLKKLVQIQKTGNKDFTLDRNSVKRQALELMRGNNATGKSSELTEILDGVYRYIGTDTELTWEGFAEKADAAADWILEHQRFQRDAYAQEVLNWMEKRRFRMNEAQVEEAKYRFGSLNEFQKQIRGTFILDQSSKTSLDQLWQEAAEMYPDQFSADTTVPDMPGALADLVHSLQGMEDTEAAYRKSDTDVRGELIQQIYDRYWNVEPVKSVSDKAAKQIDRLKAEHREAIRELKEENRNVKKELNDALREYRRQRDLEYKTMKTMYESQLRQVEQAYRQLESEYSGTMAQVEEAFYQTVEAYEKSEFRNEHLKKTLAEALEDAAKEKSKSKEDLTIMDQEFRRLLRQYETSGRNIERLKASLETARKNAADKVERAKRTELRGKTFRAMNAINRMLLNPGKTLYVPDSLQPAVIRFMQGLTGEIQKSPKGTLELRGNLESLQAAYANLANLNKGVISPEIHEGVAAMLSDAMDAIGDTEFKNLNREQLTEVYNAVKSVLHTIRNANKMYAENLRGTYGELADLTYREFSMQESREKVTGAFREQADTLSWNMEKPVYAAMRLGSDTMLRLYQNLRSGEDTWARDFREARAYAMGTMAKYNYDKFTDEIVTLTDRNGKKVGLNLEERMSLYAYARREQAVQHLTKGGFVLSSRETRSVKNRLGIRSEQRVSDFNTYVLGEGQRRRRGVLWGSRGFVPSNHTNATK